MSLSDELKNTIRGEVDDSAETLETYSRDASLFKVRPEVVVRPKNAEDIQALVKFVAAKKKAGEKISITARAAGTDMSGGPLGESIIVDTTAHLNRFIELGEDYAIAEPGMYFRDFDKETKKKNLEMPGYPASRNLATIGGMVANNAGGEKNLKYGKTGRYVEELEVVLTDGEIYSLKKCQGDALTLKLAEQSFEGELYRNIAELVSKNKETIENARPKVTKNSSGYALWDVGDGKSSLNLVPLIVGSQGALGVITKIRFGLVSPKPYSSMLVMFVNDLKELGTIIPAVLAEKPDSFESYDDKTLSLAVKYFPEFAAQMKAGIISLGFSFLPEIWMLITHGIPKLILLVEFRADSQQEALHNVEVLAGKIRDSHIRTNVRIAKDEKAARKYWTIRRESFSLLRKKVRGMKTAPFIDDFVVLPSTLPEFLPKLNDILLQYDLTYTIAGHVGDGNFHIIPLIDPKKPGMAKVIDELSHKVYNLVISYHGSISGEHNDGLVRTPYVRAMFGPEMTALFEEVEKIFDPLGIFNPGKKVGTSFAESAKKLDVAQ
ncbi:MAG TPA: FAD-binding oxidoreductase [Candidatus Paceibacterota bacterium]